MFRFGTQAVLSDISGTSWPWLAPFGWLGLNLIDSRIVTFGVLRVNPTILGSGKEF
ncbi:hypothetical protein LINPERPRIM_LOCUS6402 [Linum perenne]